MAERFLYPGAGENAQPEVKQAIRRFRLLPADERRKLPLLYWLLGEGTPGFKVDPEDANYTKNVKGPERCGNCEYAYKTAQGDFICSQVRGPIRPQDWCDRWLKARK